MEELEGKLIVFEGLDGCGKSTQIKRVRNFLEHELDYPTVSYHFPTENNLFGKMVHQYLNGEVEGNSYYIATLYANDRYVERDKIIQALEDGMVVFIDRYVYSALAYQSIGFSKAGNPHFVTEKEKFIDWLVNYEFEQNNLPEPDKIIYLRADMDIIESNLKDKKGKDLHESKLDFLKQVDESYLDILEYFDNTEIIDCSKEGEMLSESFITDKIYRRIVSAL